MQKYASTLSLKKLCLKEVVRNLNSFEYKQEFPDGFTFFRSRFFLYQLQKTNE